MEKETLSFAMGLVFSTDLTQVLLVHKNRPEKLSGKLNGVGGLQEKTESTEECMTRECLEEVGLDIAPEDWHKIARIVDGNRIIDCFTVRYMQATTDATQKTDETIEWCLCDHLPDKLVADLRLLISLARAKLDGEAVPPNITLRY